MRGTQPQKELVKVCVLPHRALCLGQLVERQPQELELLEEVPMKVDHLL